ncbi:MAG: ATP-binding protein [Verrucomicrobia bacterium]|nr:ATP-binding protein [Verrucomicrobiota bacterium]
MPRNVPPQIRTRIAALLAGLVVLLAIAIAGIHWIEERGRAETVADEANEHGRLLDALLMHAGRPLRLFVETNARRVSFTRPGEAPRGASPETTLRAGLRTFGVDAAWVLEADGVPRLSESLVGPALDAPPITGEQLAALPAPTASYYVERAGIVYRIRGARLAADGTHPNAPRGWLFAARRWDRSDLARPALPIEGRLTFVAPTEAGRPASEELPVRIERMLRDVEGRPLKVLRVEYRPNSVDVAATNDSLEMLVMAGYAITTFGVLLFCLFRWVVAPAGEVQRILEERDSGALRPMIARGGYLAKLAELVRQLLETQDRLKQTLNDRERLGRDLHDGAIQTIYAAGMGLAAARANLRADPANAENQLDNIRAELNATIVDLRSFLHGLEPEPSERRTFGAAVRAMTGLMEAARNVSFSIEIDEAVAARLSAEFQMQLLQIVREAVSNAVRHGGARSVTVALRSESGTTTLAISDDGRSTDSPAMRGSGRGLANFQARAHELGGTITVAARPAGGVVVTLLLPPKIEP